MSLNMRNQVNTMLKLDRDQIDNMESFEGRLSSVEKHHTNSSVPSNNQSNPKQSSMEYPVASER